MNEWKLDLDFSNIQGPNNYFIIKCNSILIDRLLNTNNSLLSNRSVIRICNYTIEYLTVSRVVRRSVNIMTTIKLSQRDA